MNEKVADAGGFPGISGKLLVEMIDPDRGGDMKLNHETCGFNHDNHVEPSKIWRGIHNP